ncbi:MAG: hypothetical protein JXA66_02660 [Oligoflexia bacterium]|nr:hypothetical protein [Oligoflexia bacterium]
MRPVVMIYSSDSSFVFSARSRVANCGYYVVTAMSVEEARLRINLYPPHIVLADFSSDKEFVELLWAANRLKNIPVLFSADSEVHAAAQDFVRKKLGGVIPKPMDLKILDTKIRTLINKSRTETPLYIKFEKEKLQKVVFRMEGRITELSEAGFTMESGVKFFETIMVKLRSRFFINVGFDPPFSILLPKETSRLGFCDGSFVGLKEEEAMLIRAWLNKRLTRKGV